MYIKVRVIAGAKKEHVVRESDEAFTLHVKEPAERNLANKRVIEIIAGEFGVPTGNVRMVTGHHSPGKILSVEKDKK